MANISDKVLKGLHTSRTKLYLDGDPMPYYATATIPAITHPTDEFDNISTGGTITVADPYRYVVSDMGEIVFEAADTELYKKIHDASKVYRMNIAIAENNYQPQLGQIIPVPVNFKIGAQFAGIDNGTIQMGTKRQLTASYYMLSYKIEISGVTVVNFDFLANVFEVNDIDLLSDISEILG